MLLMAVTNIRSSVGGSVFSLPKSVVTYYLLYVCLCILLQIILNYIYIKIYYTFILNTKTLTCLHMLLFFETRGCAAVGGISDDDSDVLDILCFLIKGISEYGQSLQFSLFLSVQFCSMQSFKSNQLYCHGN